MYDLSKYEGHKDLASYRSEFRHEDKWKRTHAEHVAAIELERPCNSNDYASGGGCFNCLWSPETDIYEQYRKFLAGKPSEA